jgi:cytochrome oxidase assembly protein ShyY1
MYRFLLKPRWLAVHVLVIALVVVMINLGFWQLHRWQDRTAFNDAVRSRSAVPTAAFSDVVVSGADPADIAWRTVTVDGIYLDDEQVIVVNRSQSGVPGFEVVTPMQLDDGSLVLVDRGFVTDATAVPAAPTGMVTVIGRLREPEGRHLGGLTDPSGDLTEVQRIDIDRLAPQLPAPVAPVFIALLDSTPDQGDPPTPIRDPELSSGPHLSYMIQWWVFSAAAVAGWVIAVRRGAAARAKASAPGG